MTRETIDQRTVTRALKQARKTHARVVVRDSMKAFALRISATGVIAYTLQYRDADGRQRLYTLPESECSTPLQARACAESLRNRIRDGSFDPLRARRVGHERQEAERKARHTVAELCDVWLERRTDKRSLSGDRSVINAHVKPKLGHFRLDELTRRDVADAMKAIAPKIYQANRFHSLVTSLLNFAGTGSVSGHEGLGWLKPAVNVAKGIRRDHEEPRDQVLSPDQLQRLLAVIDRYRDTPSARAVRLLMFTLARKNEVLGARWSEFSLETEPAFWTKPSSRVKSKRTTRVPLVGGALELLREMKAETSVTTRVSADAFVFPGRVHCDPAVRRFWTRVRREAGLPNLRLHDLRHVGATALASSGVPLFVVARLLGHASMSAVTERYSHLSDHAAADAMAALSTTYRNTATVAIEAPK